MQSKSPLENIGFEFISVCIIDGEGSFRNLKSRLDFGDCQVESVQSLSMALRFLETRINIALILIPVVHEPEKALQTIHEIRKLKNYKHKPIHLILNSELPPDLAGQCLNEGGIDWIVLKGDEDLEILKNRMRTFVSLEKEKLTSANYRFPQSSEYKRSLLNENRFLATFDHASIAFFMADLSGRLLEVNSAFEKATGYSLQDVHLKHFSSITHPEDDEAESQLIEKMKSQQLPGYTIEKRFIHKDGRVLWMQASLFLVRDQVGTPVNILATLNDITVRKNAEETLKSAKIMAETANAAKTAFLANMSHEIRTPLGAIMGFIDLMKQPDLNQQCLTQYLAIMERNSHQLSRLLDDILDLSKIEAGKMSVENINFSLTDFLNDFSAMMSFRAQENGITFRFDRKGELPELINSDPLRLRQILINGVGNAIKFTQKGTVTLEVSYENQFLNFLIIDTGRGISAAQAQNLFQVFTQADPSTTRKFGGTGLGLALSRSLCQMLGGNFTLEQSELGKGSTFLARIRVNPTKSIVPDHFINAPLLKEVPSPVPGNSKDHVLKGLRVLLVEDAPDNQVLISLILRRAGAHVEVAPNGLEGVKKAQSQPFDVVLMDIQMPIMDGHEATRTLRKQGFQRPIIALTAHAMKEELEQTRISGFSKFMTKPVQRMSLIAALQDLRHTSDPLN